MLRTLGARLTALATGITLAVSFLVCIVLYVGVYYSLHREVDSFLAGEVMEFRAILFAAGGDLGEVQDRIRSEIGSRERRDLTFRLLDSNGHVLLTSEWDTARLPDPWPPPEPHAEGTYCRTEGGSGRAGRTRTCSQWLRSPGGVTRIIQAAYSLDQVDASLTRLVKICVLALGAAAVLAAIGGRILASRSLRPVGKMAAAARKISVENLTERLERRGTGDELDRLAETFNDMFERLERQVAQLRQFTADAAHELRTPLAALRGNAEMALSRTRSPEELREALADSIDEYDRLSRIADDLLLLARADAGQEFVRRAPFRLDLALEDVVDLFVPVAEERGVGIHCSAVSEVWIDGDDGRLRQMLGNLLDNAVKYTPPGGRVDVSLAASNGMAEVTVRDTGAGIAPQHLPHVFDRFYRADLARGRDGGAGLGLAISRTIAEAHRGRIRLTSAPDRGTTATVVLPIREKHNGVLGSDEAGLEFAQTHPGGA